MKAVVSGPIPDAKRRGVTWFEWAGIASLLFACNLHLVHGSFPASTTFLPDRVAAGEVWRLLSHAFAHVSWYHLSVDAAAFLMLYQSLGAWRPKRRVLAALATIAGSLLFSLSDPRLATIGLCGLSGSAHGLMALVALDGLRIGNFQSRRFSLLALCALLFKCIAEILTGGALFASWHWGSVGVPIVACHLGGVAGALGFHFVHQLAKPLLQRETGEL